ncbi:molybdate ABC transporter substrate-binding protein [Sporolactobacillus sp. CQH2019]|uniref:molybdate ABC transporter substrate-binding protein n=1 Tax=Sporolactobacillus sp. CQH2019 TaxID=3023512 RepID=UPI0023685BB7|nr:molybdate ABC transporter substrate-binding protein [Sporolactobacillus sp. CQH2019]MDD9149612.1 molybdate ABC transporter substrate-binding protein [Sporolactobacillus sp. CQH2019]
MKNHRFLNISILSLVLILILATLMTGCSNGEQGSKKTTGKEKEVTLTVAAAASLQNPLNKIKELYMKGHPDVKITYNFGGSGALQQQIEQGAPIDLFFSAATKQMTALKNEHLLIDSSIKNLLKNDVVLIVPKTSTDVKSLNDLTKASVKKVALGEPASVPAGQYGKEVLTHFQLMDKLKSKAVYGKDVETVLNWVATGNADAGIVYKTDALSSKSVRLVTTAPAGSHDPVVYPAAVIKGSKHAAAAKQFLNYLTEDTATKIFKNAGFEIDD